MGNLGKAVFAGIGAKMLQVDLDGCRSLDEAQRRGRGRGGPPPGGWVLGRRRGPNPPAGKGFPPAHDPGAPTRGRPAPLCPVVGPAICAHRAAPPARGGDPGPTRRRGAGTRPARPAATSRSNASRTGVILTPIWLAMSSWRSQSPGLYFPAMIWR